ncbi:unnamed protein product [Pseudo-nitzschia multistriata]|uniref:Uncharacterized protein n=1 Tax=Pseudo-nitzschia multistriata TaxID=183589 RepID=A0A448ZER3_9STRA|nr:unnamed protein product [Pseudo-nitzschia multistriata]
MSTLSFASQSRLRRIPRALKRVSAIALPSASPASSVERTSRRIYPVAARHKSSSSASIADYLFPDSVKESVQESVKTSILEKVTRDESKVWTSGPYSNGNKGLGEGNGNQLHQHQHPNGGGSSVDEQISAWHHDELDDLLLNTETTQYWPDLPPGVRMDADPFQLSKGDVDSLSESIREDLLGTDHPVLNQAAAYFFGDADGGKKVRPLMVMLLSRALADTVGGAAAAQNAENGKSTESALPLFGNQTNTVFSMPLEWQRQDLPRAQRRLAEISEMIHTASLFHDDVIDGSETRRGVSAVHMVFGNKMAILAGDYLLARASISLARLRHVEVVECMSTIIEHLVRGEVMQMRGTVSSEGDQNERMVYYLKKNYYKTGSLMANSCKSAALLAECPPELVVAAYKYGKHVGMAFQLVDDVLDFEGDVKSMGKPALADLKAGLSTAPVLFAAEEYPQLEAMMDRKFKEDGDVETSRALVLQSRGIERTKELARVHAERAMEAILPWEATEHRDALINLAYKVVQRTT